MLCRGWGYFQPPYNEYHSICKLARTLRRESKRYSLITRAHISSAPQGHILVPKVWNNPDISNQAHVIGLCERKKFASRKVGHHGGFVTRTWTAAVQAFAKQTIRVALFEFLVSRVLSLSFPRYFPLRTLSVLIVYTENFQLTIIVRPHGWRLFGNYRLLTKHTSAKNFKNKFRWSSLVSWRPNNL